MMPIREFRGKDDMATVTRRWDAYWAGEILDRPIVCATAPLPDRPMPPPTTYRDRVFGDLEEVVDRMLARVDATYWGGDEVPNLWCSFGPDETAVWCGAEFKWGASEDGDTNWSEPLIADWEAALPIRLDPDNWLWRRMLAMQEMLGRKELGRITASPFDTHTNMDLLSALRGPQDLCMDLFDCPEVIDRAMASARRVFPQVWNALREAGQWDRMGYWQSAYSSVSTACIQCDFSCMISPEMFRRWVMPALEEEAAIVGHAYYHWDGPDAVKHLDDLCSIPGLHTLSYVPGVGHGVHLDYLEMFRRVQAHGRAVHFRGTPDECRQAHRALKPELTMYSVAVNTPAEADAIVEWFASNT